MRLLELVIVFGVFALAYLTKGQKYDDLAKDECFKNAYLCGDSRMSVTDATGRLVTERVKFGEICRKHKEFMSCITQASIFCADNLTDFSRMVLDNRMSLKMFCTDLEWKRNYFRSAPCINRYEQEVTNECRREEAERIDDRPWWCLIPEPCDAMRRVFLCSVQKMEEHCGTKAAEVYRRMHILKEENQDVVCEYRRRNPVYCRYRTTERPRKTELPEFNQQESIKRMGSLSSSVSEAVTNLVQAATVDIIGDIVTQSEDQDLDSSELRFDRLKYIIDKVKEKVVGEILLGTNTRNEKLNSKKYYDSKEKSGFNSEDVKKLLQAFDLVSKYTIGERKKMLNEFCHFQEMPSSDCLRNIKGRKEDKSPNSEPLSPGKLPVEGKYVKDSIFKLYELLKHEDAEIVSVDDEHVELHWRNLMDFPMKGLSCAWQNLALERVFTCDVKFKYSSSKRNDINLDDIDSNLGKLNIHSFEEPYVQDLLTQTEASLREAMDEQDGSFYQEAEDDIQFLADMFSTKNPMLMEVSSISIPDIHRNGYQAIPTEVTVADNADKEAFLGEKGMAVNSGSIDGESFILLGDPYYPTDSDIVYINMNNAGSSTTETYIVPPGSYSEQFESLDVKDEPEAENSILKGIPSAEENKEEFQLRTLEDALSERFSSNDVISELKEVELHNEEASKRLDGNLVHNYSNKECPTEGFAANDNTNIDDTQNYEPLNLNGATGTYTSQKSYTSLGNSQTTTDCSPESSIEYEDRNTEARIDFGAEISEGSTLIELNSMKNEL